MRPWILAGAAAGFLLLPVLSASGDDSSASLGMGGIVLTKSADIRMAREDLAISPLAVKVRYEFVNDSAHDIDTIVAFPLPDIDQSEFSESPLGTTKKQSPNFVGFALRVDGRTVTPTAEERAVLKGRDVTGIIRAAGLPLNLAGTDLFNRLPHLPFAQRKTLVEAGLLDIESEKGPDLNGTDFHPLWTTKTKFWWHQRFPARKTVHVEHAYQPVTGQSFFSKEELGLSEDASYYAKTYCLDTPTKAVVRAKLALRKAPGSDEELLNAYATDFVLKTANNWKGPIGHFHLTLDKLKPDNILSLCWDGTLTKTGPTRFEGTRENFAPKRDIQMLVLW